MECAERFLRQADELQDLPPLEVLCHSIWQVSIKLTDARPLRQPKKRHPRLVTTIPSAGTRRASRAVSRNASMISTGVFGEAGGDNAPAPITITRGCAVDGGRAGPRRTSASSDVGSTSDVSRGSVLCNPAGRASFRRDLNVNAKGPRKTVVRAGENSVIAQSRQSSVVDTGNLMTSIGTGVVGVGSVGEGRTTLRRLSTQSSATSAGGVGTGVDLHSSILRLDEESKTGERGHYREVAYKRGSLRRPLSVHGKS